MAPSVIALYVRVAFAVARGDWGLLAATIRDHTGSAADVEDLYGRRSGCRGEDGPPAPVMSTLLATNPFLLRVFS